MVDREEALDLHSKNPGKISVETSVEINSRRDLDLVYTPGVAEPCKEIAEDSENSYRYTSRGNMVAVVSDGSAVLGLGDIGPEASMPVMEGKANLLKKFGDVNTFPLVLDTETEEDFMAHLEALAPSFGGINLEDIKAPECFRIEQELDEKLDIPVFHDDQHGTAIVVAAALRNSLEKVGKDLQDARIVVIGVGAAGYATIEFLRAEGAENIVPVDSSGILESGGNEFKQELYENTLASGESGDLGDAMEDADVMIGLSIGGIVSQDMVGSMAEDPVIFALANPDPEILPSDARDVGAAITATGRSDFENQVNNSLAFPGIFRGALDARAAEVNEEMKITASKVISDYADTEKGEIVPETVDKELAMAIAEEVEKAARKTGVAQN